MSNSPLVNYTKISPNRTVMTNKKVTKITIHHMAGKGTVKQCGDIFANPAREASSNYAIDNNCKIGMYVEEKDRAWTSSNWDNDSQAVTIEVANDTLAPNWTVSDKVYAKLIDLCVDICKRNGIKKLNYTGDKTGNLTMHCFFAPTACPGPYLKPKFPDIAAKVNARLATSTSPKYFVRKTWKDAGSQIGAYAELNKAKKACKAGYSVFDKDGKSVYNVAVKKTVKTYTVKKGDTLSTIGKATGVAWKTLAEINGIKSPYTIKVGQVLKLSK